MILAGNRITTVDQLQIIGLEDLVKVIKAPEGRLFSLINQVRIAKSVSEQSYRQLKKQLPYIVCASLNPQIRKTENFVYAEYFILDIDHVSTQDIDIRQLRSRIQQDGRVVLCYVSPGEDGLKVMFRFSERCTDSGLYSLFYKEFARRFAVQYGMEQVVDSRTSDVCRACFVSYDPDIYYNPEAEGVAMKDYLDLDNPLKMSDLRHELVVYEKEKQTDATLLPAKVEPTDDDFAQIRQILNLRRKEKVEQAKCIFVPEELNAVMCDVVGCIEDAGVEVVQIRDINYGKKIVMSRGQHTAEVNVFFGKKGFSVVQSPKAGTNQELNAMMAELIHIKLTE